jgi:hypothetical protein
MGLFESAVQKASDMYSQRIDWSKNETDRPVMAITNSAEPIAHGKNGRWPISERSRASCVPTRLNETKPIAMNVKTRGKPPYTPRAM